MVQLRKSTSECGFIFMDLIISDQVQFQKE